MKKIFNVRNIIGLAASALTLVVFCLSFAVRAIIADNVDGNLKKLVFYNSVWGSTEARAYENGELWDIIPLKGGVSPFPIIGFLLILIIGILAVQTIIFNKKNKNRKWTLFACGMGSLVSCVFQMLGGESALVAYAKEYGVSVQEVRDTVIYSDARPGPGTLGLILGIVTILIGIAFVISAFLPETLKEENKEQ